MHHTVVLEEKDYRQIGESERKPAKYPNNKETTSDFSRIVSKYKQDIGLSISIGLHS